MDITRKCCDGMRNLICIEIIIITGTAGIHENSINITIGIRGADQGVVFVKCIFKIQRILAVIIRKSTEITILDISIYIFLVLAEMAVNLLLLKTGADIPAFGYKNKRNNV